MKDGKPVSPADLDKQDRERQKKVMEYARKLEREPAKVRAAEQKKRDQEKRETEQAVNDALLVYDIKMLGGSGLPATRPSRSPSRRGRTPSRRRARAR